jgi:enoyl-[acyl-carrier protein] reductase I
MVMQGKKGLIIGVANKRSIAYGVAKSCVEQGADVAFTYINDRFKTKLEPIIKELGNDKLYKLDASSDEDLVNLVKSIEKDFGKIDFIVHSIAFADKEGLSGRFMNVSKKAFNDSLEISAFSLLSITKALYPLLNEGSSILTMSYLGAVKYIPNYNLMGVAKAALESTVRYLAVDLGSDNIRVNAISAGPIKTLAASGIGDFSFILKWNKHNAPSQRNVTINEVGDSGMYLLSDLSRGVTGEIHYVDGGYNVMGMAHVSDLEGKPELTYIKNIK